jgi:hypothetical protein
LSPRFVNPYADLVAGRDPVELYAENTREVAALVGGWPAARWTASYAPGKWSAARILLHMLHVEIVDGYRLRLALTDPEYVVQPFDPEAFMAAEPLADGKAAFAAWSALRPVHEALLSAVPAERWDRPFRHPEAGEMTIRDLAGIWSGHDRHHLAQLRAIAAGG